MRSFFRQSLVYVLCVLMAVPPAAAQQAPAAPPQQPPSSGPPRIADCPHGRAPDGQCMVPPGRGAENGPQGGWRTAPQAQPRETQPGAEQQPGVVPELKRPVRPRNDFELFVERTVGEKLEIFGSKLFEDVPSTFAPADQVPVSADYAVGPGDQILIRAWGQVDIDYSATVDRTGNIYIPQVGNVNVAGVKYGQLHGYLENAISRVFHDFDLAVSMGQLRSIQVLVVGQASRPGNYTISALSTLVNALFASGGPSPNGSMRSVQLKRGNRTVVEFDLYDLLLKGDKSKDAQLQNGDVIFVPPVGDLVAISGSVNVPAIYEIKGETTLEELLRIAGGLTTTAEAKQVRLERIADRTTRRVETIALDKPGLATPLRDGDIAVVVPMVPKFENAVTLRGNVARPGRFPWREGMRVHDLIPSREALVVPEFWESKNAVALRKRPEGQLAGALQTEIRRDTPEINWDYAVIERTNLEKLTTELIPFNLGRAIADPNSPDNVALQPLDIVTIFSQADFPVPIEHRTTFVRLEGEFVRAGVYQVTHGERLHDVIQRAGGLTPDAYVYGARLTRPSVRVAQQKRFEEFLDRLQADVLNANSQLAATTPEAAANLQLRLQNQQRLIANLRQFTPNGRVVLDVRSTETGIEALPNLELEDGDIITVTSKPGTVSVIGSVFNSADFLYREGRTVRGYLTEAGGTTREAAKSEMYVIRASGVVRSRRAIPEHLAGSFMNVKLMPGDTVVVPQDFERVPLLTRLKDWTQVLSQFGLGVAAIRVLVRGTD